MTEEIKNIETFVLEDDPDDRQWIEEIFIEEGIEPFSVFSNSDELYERLDKKMLLLVLDFILKDIRTCIEIIEHVRKENPGCYVIIMSGQDSKKVFIQLINAKADYYVDKEEKEWLKDLSGAVKHAKITVLKELERIRLENKLKGELRELSNNIYDRIKHRRENDTGSD